MDTFVKQLAERFPELTFEPGDQFLWSPATSSVHYRATTNATDVWSLLHETSHGLLGHANFASDFELLSLESAAWARAEELAALLELEPIDREYIEDCLDTYRDWLHRRCTCPVCGQESLQTDPRAYRCLNCSQTWQVTQNRHCRLYRARKSTEKNTPD
jgi:hypothetical protein